MTVLVASNCPLVRTQGSGYVIAGFCSGLRDRGHEVDVLEPASTELAPFLRKARSFRLALGMRREIGRAVSRRHYDVVELYGGETCLAADWLHRREGRKFLVVAHSNGIEMHVEESLRRELGTTTWDGTARRWWQRLLRLPVEKAFTSVDGIVTVSQHDGDYALKNGLQPATRIRSIENSLSQEFLGRPLGLERAAVIGYCGSWIPRKGVRAMEGAIPRILEQFPEAEVRLIGVGSEFVKAKHFPPAACERIQVVPFISEPAEMIRQYERLSICVMPSICESFGLVSAEAMACGCAVVATPTGFPAGLRNGHEVLLTKDFGWEALASALDTLLRDDPLRRRIAAGGYRRVQDLRWERAISELEATYVEWLGEVRAAAVRGEILPSR